LSGVPAGKRFEAREIRVEASTFSGGGAPVAFVGVDGAKVRFNTIYHPGRWAIRILQETATADFIRCRNGVFQGNLIVFQSTNWSSGGVNIGPSTSPESFEFRGNFWFCEDVPSRSKPTLPTAEEGGVYGKDPLLKDPPRDLTPKPGSPAELFGAYAFSESTHASPKEPIWHAGRR
jgi:hypothetical protein